MLASVPRVTEAVAKGIVAEYPTVRRLYEGWEACEGERERREMLVGIGVSLCLFLFKQRAAIFELWLTAEPATAFVCNSCRKDAIWMGRRRTARSARTSRRSSTASFVAVESDLLPHHEVAHFF